MLINVPAELVYVFDPNFSNLSFEMKVNQNDLESFCIVFGMSKDIFKILDPKL